MIKLKLVVSGAIIVVIMMINFVYASEEESIINRTVMYKKINIDTIEYQNQSITTDIFIEYLKDSLWRNRDAYDAAHNLMIPLHYAVESNDTLLLHSFENHFRKLSIAYKENQVSLEGLKELQYLSLVSRYLALPSQSPDTKLKADLFMLLNEHFISYWQEKPAWQWGREPFQGGIKERINWKLENIDPRANYYNVLHDADFFTIGIAADLLSYSSKNGKETDLYQEAIDVFLEIMNTRLDYSKEGWVFQLNYWIDHRDYSYSGYFLEPEENSSKITANSIQEDSSHGHRWPLWLAQVSEVIDVSEIIDRLKWQLLNVIIEENISYKVGVPVLNNFMCGHNGYYRWNYGTHKKMGYGPYKLSGTFSLGWWSLLNDEKISEYYLLLASAYPLNESNKNLYEGISSRERHPIIIDSYKNGIRKQIALMASCISRN